MIPFERAEDAVVAELDDFEVALITSLVSQVAELIGGGGEASASDDPFDRWAGEFGPTVQLDRGDPVVERLFPDAYADAAASAEHRRLSQESLRRARIADSDVVLADLVATDEGDEPLVVADDHVEAWVKTLNGVRLSLAMRLGIGSAADHAALERLSVRDPRSQLLELYDWLGAVLESLLDAAHDHT